MAQRDLVVRFIGDDRDLSRALTRSEARVRKFDSSTSKIGNGLARGFAAAGIALGASAAFAVTARSIKAASDLNEEISKSQQVFGASSRSIEVWSQTTARSIGVARTEALQATGTFGNLFRVVDIAPEAAGQMSQALVELAADLASFNNADPSDVLQAIRSGLIGEAEPLRRYGVLLSETRVQQEAMAATGKDNVKELTNQEKALARYNIILQDTAPAQGDFARTSGGLANQSRILKAQLADLSAELGGNLLPVMVRLTQVANGVFDVFDRLGQGLKVELDASTSVAELEAIREKVVSVTGEASLMAEALKGAIEIAKHNQPLTPEDRGGLAGATQVARSNAKVDEQERQNAARKAKNEADRQKARFAAFIRGLGLKLDKAGLTADLGNDLAVLKEIERAILRQIQVEGKTFDLEQQLTDNRLKQLRITEQKTDAVAAKSKEVAKKKKTSVTTGKSASQKRIEEQFQALGFTSGGDVRAPGVGALRARLGSIRDQIQGTALDTDKTNSELDRIAQVLRGKFGKVGREIRNAILGMFNDISGALKSGGKDNLGGEITRGGIRSVDKLVAGLGLTQQQIDEIQRRQDHGGPRSGRPIGAFGRGFRSGANVGTDPRFTPAPQEINLYIDGEKITNVVINRMQKGGKRRTNRRGGANAGRGAIL